MHPPGCKRTIRQPLRRHNRMEETHNHKMQAPQKAARVFSHLCISLKF